MLVGAKTWTVSLGNTSWREIARDYNYKILLQITTTPQISNVASTIHWGHCGKKVIYLCWTCIRIYFSNLLTWIIILCYVYVCMYCMYIVCMHCRYSDKIYLNSYTSLGPVTMGVTDIGEGARLHFIKNCTTKAYWGYNYNDECYAELQIRVGKILIHEDDNDDNILLKIPCKMLVMTRIVHHGAAARWPQPDNEL